MPKRKTKIKRNKCKRKHKTRRYRRGGNVETVKCCMCERMVDKNNTLIPRECLMKYGKKSAHKICPDCWWDPIEGFAREEGSHECPGCKKGLPLPEEPEYFIDLTED